KQLGLKDISKVNPLAIKWGDLKLGTKLGAIEAVFPRADKSAIEKMKSMEQPQPVSTASVPPAATLPAGAHAQAGQPATQVADRPQSGHRGESGAAQAARH